MNKKNILILIVTVLIVLLITFLLVLRTGIPNPPNNSSPISVGDALKEKYPHIPIIAITGYGKEPEAVAMEKKADLVLSKPVKMSLLKKYISQFLSLENA